MYRRLLIAFLIIAFTAVLCWKVLPRIGVDVPWWVPFIGFAVILIATLGTMPRADQDDEDRPIPFHPPPDDEGEGVSAADRERFG